MGKQTERGAVMSINVGGGELRELKPRILVIGVGGAGGNAINAMIEAGMQGVEFVAVNTDAQDLKMSKADAKIQIGMNLTKGLGAGAKHDIGQAAADESINEIVNYIQGSNMVFIASGMGGGTGTGASHVIAKAAREMNILTVGVTTLPFAYEGPKRMRRAIAGLEELKKHLDTTIVVPNQNLFKIANELTGFEESFSLSNDVLKAGVQSITDLMVRPGMINFSIVGRNATLGERKLYVEHDKNTQERDIIAAQFNETFPNLIARPGGETGIDISPKGKDKSQIVQDFHPDDVLHFYGDRMDVMGNDYPLKKIIIDADLGHAIPVTNWQDTWEKLKCV